MPTAKQGPRPQGGGRRRRSRAARPSLRVGRWSLPATADRDGWPPPAVARPPGTESGVQAGSSAALLARVLVMAVELAVRTSVLVNVGGLPPARAGEPGLSLLLGLAQCAQVDCKVVGRDVGVGMVVTQHPAAPGQGVLVQGAGPLILAQRVQVGREPVGRGEGFGVVVAEHAAERVRVSLWRWRACWCSPSAPRVRARRLAERSVSGWSSPSTRRLRVKVSLRSCALAGARPVLPG